MMSNRHFDSSEESTKKYWNIFAFVQILRKYKVKPLLLIEIRFFILIKKSFIHNIKIYLIKNVNQKYIVKKGTPCSK